MIKQKDILIIEGIKEEI